jgi:hypothetical protein
VEIAVRESARAVEGQGVVQSILVALGGAGVLVAALAWLSKGLITRWMNKGIEKYKLDLKYESDTAIERLRADLRQQALEHDVKSSCPCFILPTFLRSSSVCAYTLSTSRLIGAHFLVISARSRLIRSADMRSAFLFRVMLLKSRSANLRAMGFLYMLRKRWRVSTESFLAISSNRITKDTDLPHLGFGFLRGSSDIRRTAVAA